MPTQKDTILSLAKEVLRHKALYYEGNPEISDYDYDKLEERLRALDPSHPALNVVGTENTRNKRKHKIPMLSLAKTYEVKELLTWQKEKELLGTPKIDGNSLSLIYQSGKLTLAKTRGNGVEGEDVTQKILWVKECPKELNEGAFKELTEKLGNKEIEVRGELYCEESKFLELSNKMKELGLPQGTSTRNIVAGVLSRKQHIHLARYFNFFAFNVLFEGASDFFKTEEKKFHWLTEAGFFCPPTNLLKTEKEVKNYLVAIKDEMDKHDYSSDGAVFNFNDLKLHDSLGETAHHPRYKMSFKWQGETAVTTIKEIKWSTSRFGTVTPVAHVEPVELSEAVITNVTLHNMAHVKLFKLKKGDQIEIVRSGEVIPKFLRVVKSVSGEAEIPEECPSCKWALKEEDIRLVCENKLCESRKLHRILNWIKQSGIEDLSEKRLIPLLENGKVKKIDDLYRLTKEDFLELPLTKEKLANKLSKSIEGSKKLSLVSFLCALGIEGAGKTTWISLTRRFPSLSKLLSATKEEIEDLDGFAEKMALQITLGLKESNDLIESLQKLGIQIEEAETSDKPPLLEGMTFVLTGTLSRPREELVNLLLSLGAKAGSSISKKTTALVSSDFSSKSSKTEKAKKLSIPLWSEKDLMDFIEKKEKEHEKA